ncbi:MAG: HK97 gp10 family phage protein [Thermomicrobiales bacterium]
MADGIHLKIKMNKLPQASAKLREGVAIALEKFALDVEAQATANTPVDTGTLKNSLSTAIGPTDIRLYWAAPYAAYVEFGTRHMEGQYFVSDAFENCEPALQAALADIESRIGG